jgi:hypothetical protein
MAKTQLTPEQVQRIETGLKALMSTNEGVNTFISKVTSPLRRARDLISGVRKVLQHDPLFQNPGDLPVYDCDPEAFAYVLPHQGSAPRRIRPDEMAQVTYPTWDMNVFKEFPYSQLTIARYNYLKRVEQVLRNALVQTEDETLFAILNAVVTDASYTTAGMTPVTGATSAGFTPENGSDMLSRIEDYNDAGYYIGRGSLFSGLRTWGQNIYAPVRREEIFKTGIVAYIWGIPVYKSRFAPDASLYCTVLPEFLGRLPERMALRPLSIPAPRSGKTEIGMVQNLGMGIHNPRGVAVCNFS